MESSSTEVVAQIVRKTGRVIVENPYPVDKSSNGSFFRDIRVAVENTFPPQLYTARIVCDEEHIDALGKIVKNDILELSFEDIVKATTQSGQEYYRAVNPAIEDWIPTAHEPVHTANSIFDKISTTRVARKPAIRKTFTDWDSIRGVDASIGEVVGVAVDTSNDVPFE